MYGIDKYNVLDDEIFMRRGVAKFALTGLIRECDHISDCHYFAVKVRMYEAEMRNFISQKVGCANEVAGLVTRYLGAEAGSRSHTEFSKFRENGNRSKRAQFAVVQQAICEMATRRFFEAQKRGQTCSEA